MIYSDFKIGAKTGHYRCALYDLNAVQYGVLSTNHLYGEIEFVNFKYDSLDVIVSVNECTSTERSDNTFKSMINIRQLSNVPVNKKSEHRV